MRKAARVARLARGEHRARRAAGALGVGPVRVEPEAQRDTDRRRPRLEQRHGAVDAAAHRNRDAVGIRGRADRGCERVRERVDRQRLAADRARLEQRQTAQVGGDARGVRVDDPAAVDAQPNGRPVGAACGIAVQLLHAGQGTGGESWGEPRLPPPCSDPADRAAST